MAETCSCGDGLEDVAGGDVEGHASEEEGDEALPQALVRYGDHGENLSVSDLLAFYIAVAVRVG